VENRNTLHNNTTTNGQQLQLRIYVGY